MNTNNPPAPIDLDGIWSRLPPEVQKMTMETIAKEKLFAETGQGAHWFQLQDMTPYYLNACGRAQLRERDRQLWRPRRARCPLRMHAMQRPRKSFRRPAAETHFTVQWDPMFANADWDSGYFSALKPSMSRRRRDLFREPIPAVRSALMRTAVRKSRPFALRRLPEQDQLQAVWQHRLQAGLPVVGPGSPPAAYTGAGFSFIAIDTVGDLLVMQAPHLLPDPRGAARPPLDRFLVASAYPELLPQRQVCFELQTVEGRPVDTPGHAAFGDRPEFNPIYWSVAHFPHLETVYLLDYSIRPAPGRRPPESARRFQASGYSLFEVEPPLPPPPQPGAAGAAGPASWVVPTCAHEVAELWGRRMVTHWEAWWHTRRDETSEDAARRRDRGGGPQDPRPLPPYLLVDGWTTKRRDEPEYWEQLAPENPTPPINVKVLAMVASA